MFMRRFKLETKNRGKTTISNAGISKRVFRKPSDAPGRVRIVDGQVRISKSPFSKKKKFRNVLAFEIVGRCL